MKTTLLIGSGVSLYSNVPGLNSITERIQNCNEVGRASDSNYYLKGYLKNQHQPHYDIYIRNCKTLMEEVTQYMADFFKAINSHHIINYEDYYYVLKQVNDSYLQEFENPVVFNLIKDIKKGNSLDDNQMRDLVKESLKLIECVVWQTLDIPIQTSSQYNIIKGLSKELKLENILSLNHDLILETYLQNEGIDFFDGFRVKNLNLPEWCGFDAYNRDEIRLCKLHGSLEWFEVCITKPNQYDTIIKLPRNYYPEKVYKLDSRILTVNRTTPVLLIGTFNKMLGYLSGIFEFLYEEFKKILTQTEILIVSGYGFGDKGINSKLTQWLNNRLSQKMIIIHPDRKSLITNARGHFKMNIMSDYGDHSKVKLIEKRFEDITAEEILALA